MKTSIKSILCILLLIITFFISVPNISNAGGNTVPGGSTGGNSTSGGTGSQSVENPQIEDVFSSARSFINRNTSQMYSSDLKFSSDFLFNMLFSIGVALTVIVGGILGIKFMLASAEDKAQIKELMIPYVAGCIVIYGAFGIWKLVVNVLGGI